MKASRTETLLIFPIDRRVTLEVTLGKTVTLEPWDLAVLSQGGGRISRLGAASAAAATSVFLATLPISSHWIAARSTR